MSKLFKLKEWLTLEQAVNHISTVLGETVTLADIYRLSLDGHLKLSANFVNYYEKAKKVTFIKDKYVKCKKSIIFQKIPQQLKPIKSLKIDYDKALFPNEPINAAYPLSQGYWLEKVEPRLFSIKGVWDLTMIGNERLSIEHLYHQETSGFTVEDPYVAGVFLQQGDFICQLYTGFDSGDLDEEGFPTHRLDDHEHVLVVRTKEITKFIQSLEDTPQEVKSLTSKERITLLTLVGALLKEQGINPSERGITPAIQLMVEKSGKTISENTIRKTLNQIAGLIG